MSSLLLRMARLALYFFWTLSLMPIQWAGLALGCRWAETLPAFYHRWCCRMLGFRVRLIGAPTAQRPVLFAANHVSYTDITILGSLIRGSFIAKAEVAKWPFFGCLAKLQRTVFVDRQIRSAAIQRDAISERLVGGEALILFPEGTRGTGAEVQPFKGGVFHLAESRGDVELVPAWIDNSYRVMPKGSLFPVPLLCSVTFGKPVQMVAGEQKQAFLARLRQSLMDLEGRDHA